MNVKPNQNTYTTGFPYYSQGFHIIHRVSILFTGFPYYSQGFHIIHRVSILFTGFPYYSQGLFFFFCYSTTNEILVIHIVTSTNEHLRVCTTRGGGGGLFLGYIQYKVLCSARVSAVQQGRAVLSSMASCRVGGMFFL